MSAAIFRVMLLGLLRDRGALVMSFLVPAAFFLIFASIFPATTDEEMHLDIAIADEVDDGSSHELIDRLLAAGEFVGGEDRTLDGATVRERVRAGKADVGLVIRSSPAAPPAADRAAPFLVIADPARGMAARLLTGQLRRIQIAMLLQSGAGGGAAGMLPRMLAGDPSERENVAGQSAQLNHVAYYAGAVAVLFLLFSGVHGAITLLEEGESGLVDRILAGPCGASVLVNGKFIYLVVQGCMQVGVIFVVAWLLHGVDLPGHLLPWAVTTLLASAAGAGLALALVTSCRTRRQAQTLSNVVILVLSAIGGSMVPRYLMPGLLQDLGWITPNTWALEAYTGIFWRGDTLADLAGPWCALLVSAVLGLLLSQRLVRRLTSL